MTGVYQKMKRLCPRVEQMALSSRNAVSHRCSQIGGGGVNGLTLSHDQRVRDTRNFETYLLIPNAAGQFDIALLKVSPVIVSIEIRLNSVIKSSTLRTH